MDGETRYPDVRGLPALREALSGYLSGLHAKPVAESRIQVTASGMAAITVAMAAVVRAGHRVVVHSPAWPNIANAARLRGAVVEQIDLDAQPDGGFRLDLDRLDTMMDGARAFRPEFARQSDRVDRDRGGTAWRSATSPGGMGHG